MEQPIIALQNGVVRDESRRFRTPVNFTLEAGEHIAVMGAQRQRQNDPNRNAVGQPLPRGRQVELRFPLGRQPCVAAHPLHHIPRRLRQRRRRIPYQQRWNATDREKRAAGLGNVRPRDLRPAGTRTDLRSARHPRHVAKNRSSCCRAASCENSDRQNAAGRAAYWSSKARSSDWTSRRAERSKSCSSR